MDFRVKGGDPLADGTKRKWEPIIERVEELRLETLNGRPWEESDPEEIAFELYDRVVREVRGRGGNAPKPNTLRGRFEACKVYFDFLVLTRRLPLNPMEFLSRPKAEANQQPYLTPSEDRKLALLEKSGHEIAVYALARGAALREEEICELDDADVDLEGGWITIRDGKTRAALRRIPIGPTLSHLLAQYREWRDANCPEGERFVRTKTGRISTGYVWKLVKAMARRAELRLGRDKRSKPCLDPKGQTITDIAPHALRRTYGSDLVIRDVPTKAFFRAMGHTSERVTNESYSSLPAEIAVQKILLAAGEGPFSLAGGVSQLEGEMRAAEADVNVDPAAVLARVKLVRQTAQRLERQLAAMVD
jgi:integrase